MRSWRIVMVALPYLAALAPSVADAQALPPVQADEQIVKQAGLLPDGVALLDLFRKRTGPGPEAAAIEAVLKQLRDDKPEVREIAFAELVRLGNAAIPALRRTANDLDNPVLAAQARRCLQAIEGKPGANLMAAAARLLQQQKPAGAAEVLLAYLPFADDEAVAQEVRRAIIATAVQNGRLEPAVLRALEDPVPSRRAVAIDALCRSDNAAQQRAVRPLLADPKPTVRLHAAIGLAALNEEAAVPVLIDLLAELPGPQRLEAQTELARLAGEWTVVGPLGEDDVARRIHRDLWAAWWRATDGAALLQEVRRRTVSDAEREQLQALLPDLASTDPAVRDKAVHELVARGSAATMVLRQAASSPNPSIQAGAQHCLRLLANDGQTPLPALPGPVPRLLALRKPEGAVEALLAYLPCTENGREAAQIASALSAVGLRDGKPHPALVAALEDRTPARRLAAAEILGRSGLPEQRPAVRKLLHDPDPLVRQRVALLLAADLDRDVIPVMIELLGDLPPEHATGIEEFLVRLAGDSAPQTLLGTDEASRRTCRDAWARWWREQGSRLDLTKIENPRWLLGQTLIVEQFEPSKRLGRVLELDAEGNICWQIDGLEQATDAQIVPGGHVLVVEQFGRRLTERDLKGTVVWQKQLPLPILSFQRLANGNTFIAQRNQLIEVDRNNKEVWKYARPANDIFAARRFADGGAGMVVGGLMYVHLDANSQETMTYRVPIDRFGTVTDILPGDHVLAVVANTKIVEYEAPGKVAWEVPATMPTHAVRLANGNTLVTNVTGQRAYELDRAGKVVWESPEGLHPFRARRR